jgi:DNA-binding transcriptional ArsR family regulator
MTAPRLVWDLGTAYDLFVSLHVLSEPSRYGVRGPWARGVWARLPVLAREILGRKPLLALPLRWVHTLPEPKDGATALRTLARIPPTERIMALGFSPEIPTAVWETLQNVAARRAWDDGDRARLLAAWERLRPDSVKKADIVGILDWWSRPEEFGERYLGALQAYYDAFFAEEERRIRPALDAALARGQELAERLALAELLEDLSQGVRLTDLPPGTELVLAPSFWSTPLLVFDQVSAERHLILFGARPPEASLVPGEPVPETVVRSLKALGHPTRLRILRYLTAKPRSPTELARRLRLRPPTVIHHLDALRTAGLVHLTLEAGEKRRYAPRPEAIQMLFAALEGFLSDGAGGDVENG